MPSASVASVCPRYSSRPWVSAVLGWSGVFLRLHVCLVCAPWSFPFLLPGVCSGLRLLARVACELLGFFCIAPAGLVISCVCSCRVVLL